MLSKIRNRFRRRKARKADVVDGPDEQASLPPGAMAALPAAPESVIDLRGDATDLVEPGLEAEEASVPSAPVAALAGTIVVDLVARGHLPASNGDGNVEGNGNETAPQPAEELDREAHIATTAGLTAELIGDFAARSEELQSEIEAARQRSSAALHRATDLSEALVAAADVRLAEVREASERQQLDASERLATAIEILDRARTQADELIELAHRAAAQIVASTDQERVAVRALNELERERGELEASARDAIRAATDDFNGRLAELEGELEAHVAGLLRAASAERKRPQPVDEIDRRLALAVKRAFSEV